MGFHLLPIPELLYLSQICLQCHPRSWGSSQCSGAWTEDGRGWDIFADRRSVSGLGNLGRVSGASWVLKVITANISRSSLYPLCPGPTGHLFGLEHTWVFFRPWLILRCPEVEGQKFNPMWLISWKTGGGSLRIPQHKHPVNKLSFLGPKPPKRNRDDVSIFPSLVGARVSHLCLCWYCQVTVCPRALAFLCHPEHAQGWLL